MNCPEAQIFLQHQLDGHPPEGDSSELARHLAECAACRSLEAGARRLREGLRFLAPPLPPADLTRRIVSQALAQHRRRTRHRRLLRLAVAACLLVSLAWGLSRPKPSVPDLPVAQREPDRPPPPAPAPSLQEGVQQAGDALAALTRQLADSTRAPTRLLTPMPLPDAAAVLPPDLQPEVARTAASLRETRETMVAGLEPVTTSARRAVDLFMREIPPLGPKTAPQ